MHDEPGDQCMISHVISAWSASILDIQYSQSIEERIDYSEIDNIVFFRYVTVSIYG